MTPLSNVELRRRARQQAARRTPSPPAPSPGALPAIPADAPASVRADPRFRDPAWLFPEGRSDSVRWAYFLRRLEHGDSESGRASRAAVGAPLGLTGRQVLRRLSDRPYPDRATRGYQIKGGPRRTPG